ncbi:MAG TPA: zinc ribbon domain-containing protein, partial [Gemmatimonadaceae bacterium]|nr:zinc ribbon domain-containing protein [Gemmatimonadaceae bacterium]
MPGSKAAESAKCRKCGKHIDPALAYCGHCGTRVNPGTEEHACPSCSASYVKGVDLFCSRCGTRVGQRVSVSTRTAGFAPGQPAPAGGPSIAVLDEQG